LEDLGGRTGGFGAQEEARAGLVDLDLLDPVEVAQDLRPFEIAGSTPSSPW